MDGRLKDAGLIGTRSEPRDVVRLVGPDEMPGTTAAHVYVVGLVDSIWPQPPRVDLFDTRGLIDVDRRLFLGAIMGAEESLTLTFARDYWGTIVVPSRFLHEMGVLDVQVTEGYRMAGSDGR
jgi:superfamily I DNA/RNA helicase